MATLRRETEPRFGEIKDTPALQRATEQARATVTRLAVAFSARTFGAAPHMLKVPLVRQSPRGDVCVWTAELATAHPTPEIHLWLRVHDVLEELFFAHVVESPKNFGLAEGDTYVVASDQIEDWMINVDGLVYGGYTLRLQREGLPTSTRAEFDEYVGLHSFSAELP